MKILLFLTFMALLFMSGMCSKDEEPCETNRTGRLTVTNNSADKYDIYIDNAKVFTVDGHSQKVEVLSAKIHLVDVIQVTGINGTAKQYASNPEIPICSSRDFVIP